MLVAEGDVATVSPSDGDRSFFTGAFAIGSGLRVGRSRGRRGCSAWGSVRFAAWTRRIHVPGPSGGTPTGTADGRGVRCCCVVESFVVRQQTADNGEGDDVDCVEYAHDQQDATDAGHLVLELRAGRSTQSSGRTKVTVNSTNEAKIR